MDDLDAIRAALDPDDQTGRDLLDFDRYPEAKMLGFGDPQRETEHP